MGLATVRVRPLMEDTTSDDENGPSLFSNQQEEVADVLEPEESLTIEHPTVLQLTEAPVAAGRPTMTLGLRLYSAVPVDGRIISPTQPMDTAVECLTMIGAMTKEESKWITQWNGYARPRYPNVEMVKHVGGGWFQLINPPRIKWGMVSAQANLSLTLTSDNVFYYWLATNDSGDGYYHCLTEFQMLQLFARTWINEGAF